MRPPLNAVLLALPFLIGALLGAVGFSLVPWPLDRDNLLLVTILLPVTLVAMAGAVSVLRDGRRGALVAALGGLVCLIVGSLEASQWVGTFGATELRREEALLRLALLASAVAWLAAGLSEAGGARITARESTGESARWHRFPVVRSFLAVALVTAIFGLALFHLGRTFEVYEASSARPGTVQDLRQGPDGARITVVWERAEWEEYVSSEVSRQGPDLPCEAIAVENRLAVDVALLTIGAGTSKVGSTVGRPRTGGGSG